MRREEILGLGRPSPRDGPFLFGGMNRLREIQTSVRRFAAATSDQQRVRTETPS